MKKMLFIFTTICIVSLGVACGRTAVTSPEIITETTVDEIVFDTTSVAVENNAEIEIVEAEMKLTCEKLAVITPRNWTSEQGTYFTAIKGDDLLLHITDKSSEQSFVLCNRPNCWHGSVDCNAFLPRTVYETVDDGRNNSLKNGMYTLWVFSNGEFIYANNGSNDLYRFNFDGSGRKQVARIPCEYNINNSKMRLLNNCWLMGGKMYVEALTYKNSKNVITTTAVSVLLEIDYYNGRIRKLWEQESGSQLTNVLGGRISNNNISIIGGFENIFYVIRWEYNGDFSVAERTILSAIDITNATSAVIKTLTPQDEINFGIFSSVAVLSNGNPGVFYHHSGTNSFMQFDLFTQEISVLANGFEGKWNVGKIQYDRLFLIFVDSDGGEFTEHFIDLNTNKVHKLKLPPILKEKNGYFYITVRSESHNDIFDNQGFYIGSGQRVLVGKIKIDDYFANNEKEIQEVEWVTNEELQRYMFH